LWLGSIWINGRQFQKGKGSYGFAFSSLEDMQRVLVVGTWNLSLGILSVFLRQKSLSQLP